MDSTMGNNTIIGYNILAKRAIETESGINIDEALKKITAYRVVRGEGDDNHPSSEVTVSTKIIYFTKTDKGYLGWIWVDGEGWVCAGGGSSDSWKVWSEEHGCSASNEDAVYIGFDNTSDADYPSFQIGHDNTTTGTVPDDVEPTELVSLNLGAKNVIHGEGINIGKKNTSDNFAIAIGQNNVSHHFGIAIGEELTVNNGSVGIGKRMSLYSGAYAIGSNSTDFRVGYGSHLFGSNNSGILDNGSYLFGGQNNLQSTYGSIIVGLSNQLLYSSAGGISIFGCNNIIGNGDGPSGSVALGNYHDIKGAASVSLGIAAGSKNCSIAISAKGTNSQLGSFADSGSIAIGNRGVYAYDGSTSIGTDGVASHYHGISIGHGGVHTYNYSFAFGKNVTAHSYSLALGMDGCYAYEQSISVGRSGSVSLDRSMTFGRDGVFAWQRGIAIGEAGVQAISNAVALGLENVKGNSASISVGRAGVYTYNASVAFGNGGYADSGSMSLLNVPNQSSFSYKYDGNNDCIQNYALFWFSGKDGRDGYVDVKLTGISKNSDGYVVNGTPYPRLKDVPFRDLTVYIRGYVDEQGNIVPYYTSKDMLEPPSSEDSWVLVNWGDGWRHDDTISVRSSFSETEIGFGASGGSLVVGNTAACATNGSVAISLRNQGMEPGFSSGLVQLSNNTITISPRSSVYDYATGQMAPISLAEASSSRNSLAIGTGSKADNGSTAIGVNSFADRGSMAMGYGLWSTTNGFGKAIDDSLIISTVGYPSSGVRTRGESFCNSIAIGSGPYSSNSSQSIGVCTRGTNKSTSIGYHSRANDESIAIGDENESKYNAIGIGTMNLSSGWSIALGVHNTSYDGLGGHSTMIGQFNTSTSNLEKLEKTIKVKYEKQEALEKEISRYTTVHDKALSIVSSYVTSSEYNTIRTYEQAKYDYYVNDGPNPGYNQEYYNIKNSLVNYPPIIMSDNAWNSWYTGYNYGYSYMAEACDYYQYYLEYHDDSYLESYKEYRDYAYQYLPAWLDLMKTYAANSMTDDYVAILNEIMDAIADRPEIVPMDIFYTGTSDYYQSDYYKLVDEFYESYNSRNYATQGKIPGKLQYTYREYDSEADSLLYIIANIRRSGSSGVYIDELDETPCNSILLGANNESNHYNSILIGAKNQSAKPVSEKSKTDDDGFTFAIGYRNKVARNYDIAIGYMSEANGGENIAIQHSVAGNGNKTYHNLAMFDSTALGTGNTALQHSKVTAGYNNFALSNSTIGGSGNMALIESLADFGLSGYKSCTHNFLFHAKASGTLSSSGGLHRNVVLSAEVYGTSSVFAENFIYGGSGYSDSDYSTLNSITLNGDHSVTGNIILGHNHATTAINASTCIQNNIIMQPHGVAVDGSSFDDNVIIAGSAEVTGSYFTHNTIIGGSISGNFSVCVNNMVLENSSIIGQRSGEGAFGTLGRNLLLNSSLVLSDSSSWVSGTWTATDNFLMGISASNTMSCFAFADGVDGTRGVEARLADAVRVYNFGDNVIQRGLSIFAVGGTNEILNADKLFLFGNQNQVKGDRYSAGDSSAFSGITIIGSDNDIRHTKKVPSYGSGSYDSNGISYTNVIGNRNTVGGDNLNENWILGNVTTIHHYTDPTVITLAEFRNRVDSKQASTKIRTSEMGLVHGWTYSGSEYAYYTSYFYSGKHYYEDNMVYDGNVDGLTAVDIDVYDFINGYFAGTLTNKTLYNIKYPAGQSRAVNMQDYLPQKMYTGRMVNPDVVYNLYSGGKLESYNIATYQPDVDNAVNVLGNKLFGNDIIINAHDAMHNIILGDENFISAYEPYGLPMLNESDINAIDPNGPLVEFITVADAYVPGGKTTTSIYNNYNYFKHAGLLAEVWSYSGPKTEMSGYDFYIAFLNGTLIEDSVYHITSSYTNVPTPLPVALKLYGWKVYKKGAGIAYPEEAKDARYPESLDICNSKVPFTSLYNGTYGVHPAESVYNNLIVGTQNGIHSHIVGYSIIGAQNNVACSSTMWQQDSEFCISNGFVQGNNNIAKDGSNIISMGNGHLSTGHNSVAIGSQLISNKWQTVLGKYNEPLDGPDRLIAPENEADKALFIIGNGYSDTDGNEWQNESKIHRSNAMVVYANGDTVFSGNVNASNLPPAPSTDGRYALNCTVTNGVPSYSWVPLGTTTV